MEYELKRVSGARAIKMRLSPDGTLTVSAPRLAPKFLVDQFVNGQEAWITRQRARLALRQTANPTLNWNEKVMTFLGKVYSITFAPGSSEKVSFIKSVCFVSPVTESEKDVKTTLTQWLKHYAEGDIVRRTTEWAEKMDTSFGTIRFGQQSSRWGSCTHDNNLRFNWRLIHFAPEVIDYVVIHELAHTIHHDHSDRFWNVVGKYCVSWKTQRDFLKRQVMIKE